MKQLSVRLTKCSNEYLITVENQSDETIKANDLTVYREQHNYSPSSKIYGEGFQMLSQYSGTVENPYNITMLSDAEHYKLPQKEGFNTVYNLFTVQLDSDNCDMYAFTSCSRFNGKIHWNNEFLEMAIDLEELEIAPGQTIELEKICILKNTPCKEAFKVIGHLLKTNHPMELPEQRPSGWCSWYCFRSLVTEEDVAKNTDFISRHVPKLNYIQIDDGYQKYMGDWLTVSEKFGDFPSLISQIENSGCETAIWVAPFIAEESSQLFKEHPEYFVMDEAGKPLSSAEFTFGGWRHEPWYMLDGTNPGAREYLTHVFSVMRNEMNIKYFKLDANCWGAFSNGVRYDKNATSVEAYRQGMKAIWDGAGKDSLILGCNAPMWPSVGVVNAMRISGDLEREWCTIKILHEEIAHRSWMHNVLWINDPDVFTLINQRNSTLPDEEIRFHKSLMFMSGGMILCGDDLTCYSKENIIQAKTLLTSPFETPSVDCFDLRIIKIGSGDNKFIGIFNPDNVECDFSITLDGVSSVLNIWDGARLTVSNGKLNITLSAHDAAVFKLEKN